MKKEQIYETILRTLEGYKLNYTFLDPEALDHYPLIDALTPDGESIATGKEEIRFLADDIMQDLDSLLGEGE